MIVSLALPIPIFKTFDYRLPDDLGGVDPADVVGRRARVPFGFKSAVGMITGIKTDSDTDASKLKTISTILDPEPLLDAALLEFGAWLSKRYVCSLGEALFSLLPPGKDNPVPIADPVSDFSDVDYIHSLPHHLEPTVEQTGAMTILHDAAHGTGGAFLLHGVAAAGKTEVYLSLIKDVLEQGRAVLYLAPEIGLAVQSLRVLEERFGASSVAIWHSDLTPKERKEAWWKVRRGEAPIVVGPRSAALAPLRNIGAIIVDEEHDSSFKEERKPRFHSRDVALFRARQHKAVAVLGSATPSLESMFAARAGEMTLIEMSERAVSASAPRVELIDMRQEKSRGALSPSLESAVARRVQSREQSILFLNKRGFHRFLRCPVCTWVAKCPNCAIALVHHKIDEEEKVAIPEFALTDKKGKPEKKKAKVLGLRCHYCSYVQLPPAKCPDCGHAKLFWGGFGTQRVAEEIQAALPWAKVLRWDSDSVQKRGDQAAFYDRVRKGDVDVLVGTQMVAQGMNFPRVTLVGIVDADGPLHIPDFRSAERAFQLLAQVAGRAGRAMVTGNVLLQTRNPEHYAVHAAARLDYDDFATNELRFREDLNYPPFTHLVQALTTAKNSARAEKDIQQLADWAGNLSLGDPVGILGPAVARRSSKKGTAPFKLLFKVPRKEFEAFLKELRGFLSQGGSRFAVDVDPEMLR